MAHLLHTTKINKIPINTREKKKTQNKNKNVDRKSPWIYKWVYLIVVCALIVRCVFYFLSRSMMFICFILLFRMTHEITKCPFQVDERGKRKKNALLFFFLFKFIKNIYVMLVFHHRFHRRFSLSLTLSVDILVFDFLST